MTTFDWIRLNAEGVLLRADLITTIVVTPGGNRVAEIEVVTATSSYPKATIARVSPNGKDDYPRDDGATREVARAAADALACGLAQPSGSIWSWNNDELKFRKK